MGIQRNVDYDTFPKQGSLSGKLAKVYFNYGKDVLIGVVVRNDHEEPFLTIIRLVDGRHVLSTECQFSPIYQTKEHSKHEA